MTIEDPFEFDAARESKLASQYLGIEVEFIANVTGETPDPNIPTVAPFSYSSYPDDRDPSTSVRAASCGLPTLGKGRR